MFQQLQRARASNLFFGRFLHLEQIGQGGIARVYKAFDPSLGRTVAVKVLRLDDPLHAQRLLQEARAQAKIDQPHICKVFEAGEIEGKPYIAMQYIQGRTLKEVAPQLTELEKVQIIEEVAEAVHTANEKGIIHGDLKPANILIEKSEAGSWVPHVVDFGVAREVEAPGLTITRNRDRYSFLYVTGTSAWRYCLSGSANRCL